MEAYRNCHLCPRACGVDRTAGKVGVCRSADIPLVAHSMLHRWEEPCLVGENGSGAVFFSGCGLGCVFCQNRKISSGGIGKPYTASELSDLYFRLEEAGAANINLITAAHFIPHVRVSLGLAKGRGLRIPVVYNSSGYESVSALRSLEGLIDIYLPDFRYIKPETARRYSRAADYPMVAEAAIEEMVRQTGAPRLGENGGMVGGTIVRLLLLPTHLIETKMILRRLYHRYGDEIYISLMSQYTPFGDLSAYPELTERVKETDYRSLVAYAMGLGVTRAFVQEGSSASESFIPDFKG